MRRQRRAKRKCVVAWRKYGAKSIQQDPSMPDGHQLQRCYFRCNSPACPAKKFVEYTTIPGQPTSVSVRITGKHNHAVLDLAGGECAVEGDVDSQLSKKETPWIVNQKEKLNADWNSRFRSMLMEEENRAALELARAARECPPGSNSNRQGLLQDVGKPRGSITADYHMNMPPGNSNRQGLLQDVGKPRGSITADYHTNMPPGNSNRQGLLQDDGKPRGSITADYLQKLLSGISKQGLLQDVGNSQKSISATAADHLQTMLSIHQSRMNQPESPVLPANKSSRDPQPRMLQNKWKQAQALMSSTFIDDTNSEYA